METGRRSFLQLLGISPMVARSIPSIAPIRNSKSLKYPTRYNTVEREDAECSEDNRSYVQRMVDRAKQYLNSGYYDRSVARRNVEILQQRIDFLSPEIDCLKSVSATTKYRMTQRRVYDRDLYLAKREKEVIAEDLWYLPHQDN